MSNDFSPYPTFAGSVDDPTAPTIYVTPEGQIVRPSMRPGLVVKALGRPHTAKEVREQAEYDQAFFDLARDLGRRPTQADEGYWRLPTFSPGSEDPELVEQIAKEKALAEGRTYEAPQSPAEAPQGSPTPPAAQPKVKVAPAAPDASGVIYVPGKVCRDCGARIERKPGAGRPPAKCLACRAKDAAAAAEKAARKAAAK